MIVYDVSEGEGVGGGGAALCSISKGIEISGELVDQYRLCRTTCRVQSVLLGRSGYSLTALFYELCERNIYTAIFQRLELF
jgi:hypothetical protein